jgi:hypothetical protein
LNGQYVFNLILNKTLLNVVFKYKYTMKILYAVTYSVEPEFQLDFLKYLKEVHIPAILDTQLLVECKIFRIMFELNGGVSFSCQYHFQDRATYDIYHHQFNLKHKYTLLKAFKGKYVDFNALMEEA